MEYNSEGYGSTVEHVKQKNYKIPIIIVIVVAVIAAILIYYVMSVAKTVTLEGESLTISNLSDYVDDMADYFSIDKQDFTLYKDSSVSVENGSVTDLTINTAMQYTVVKEYWQVQDDDSGIKMKYKEQLDSSSQSYYTLPQLCAYLNCIDNILNENNAASYTAKFATSVSTTVQSGSYLWDGEAFELLTDAQLGAYYAITITTADGTQYLFYAV